MSTKAKVLSVEIEGFRGISDKRTFNFNNPLTVLFGRNGSGKSSVLLAIEWCLFGNAANVNYLESKVKDELVNQFHAGRLASVKVVLERDEQRYEISRKKLLGSRNTSLHLSSPEGEYSDENAKSKFFSTFNITFDDFTRAVFLHQESIRALLIEDASDRDEAMDRLFGLENVRNIVESIPMKRVRDKIDELDTKRQNLERKISGAIQQMQIELEKAEAKAREAGIQTEMLYFETAAKIARDLVTAIQMVSADYDLEKPPVTAPTDMGQVDSFLRKCKTTLKQYRLTLVSTTEIGELTAKRTNIETLFDKMQGATKELEQASRLLEEFVRQRGSEDSLVARKSEVNAALESCDKKRNELDINARLVVDAIQMLDLTMPKLCPVCYQEFDYKVSLDILRKRSSEQAATEIRELDEAKASLQKEIREIDEHLQTVQKLSKAELEVSEVEIKVMNQLMNACDLRPVDKTSLIMKVPGLLDGLSRQISAQEEGYGRREKEFAKIEESLEKIGMINDVLKKKDDFSGLQRFYSSETQEIEVLKSGISELGALEENLSLIVRTAARVQVSLAKQMVNRSIEDVDRYYRTLCKHPYYAEIKIDVNSRESRGLVKNSYWIRGVNLSDRTETLVSTRFSTGQMNCVALSIYLALAKVLSHGLGFLILDDPSQNLDTDHKKVLVSLLAESCADNQILVSTQDEELHSMLSQIERAQFIEFQEWTKAGPVIRI